MRKTVCALCLLIFALIFALDVHALGSETEIDSVSVNILNNVVEYSPMGHYPVADAGDYSPELRYEVTDNATGQRVTLPIMNVGTYTVRAYVNSTATHSGAEAMATFKVTPATVYISVKQQTVAHTAMENPIRYTLSPYWATGLIDIDISYRAIDNYGDAGRAVDAPVDMGMYLVRMDANPKDERVVCAGKYLIYTIGESYGNILSDEEAMLTVPKSFVADVEALEVEYTGEEAVPQCKVNVAGVESTVKYSRIFANGSNGEYTDEPPTEPGDYIASCFVLDTVIGSNKVVINKMIAEIYMEDTSFPYTPEGIRMENVRTEPEGISLNFSAYKYVNGVATEGVQFPLVECGTYMISAAPADIYRYSYVDSVSYCYITIEKNVPEIIGNDVVTVEDGSFKSIRVSISPSYAEYDLTYYKVGENGAELLMGAPVRAGEYFAVVSVKETDILRSATKSFGIYIQSNVDENLLAAAYVVKVLCYMFIFSGIAVALFHILWVKKKTKESNV